MPDHLRLNEVFSIPLWSIFFFFIIIQCRNFLFFSFFYYFYPIHYLVIPLCYPRRSSIERRANGSLVPYLCLVVPLVVNDVGTGCENHEHGILELMIRRLALSPLHSIHACHLDKSMKCIG